MHYITAFFLALLFSAVCSASVCDTGKRQSPIDIRASEIKALPALQFHYQPGPLTISNDGHTARVRLSGRGNVQIGSTTYALQQFHFHTPGGDRISGEEFPMAAHVLHKSPAGQLLAVVVLFRTGGGNPLMEKVLTHTPTAADGDHKVPYLTVNAAELLPSSSGYFRYVGSLTSEPCTEGVDWVILKQPVELSVEQLARYRSHFADNARTTQPLNGRVVTQSK
jgi:carbonic anhydrase